MLKTVVLFLFVSIFAFACPKFEIPVPMIDAYVKIDAKKDKTSFDIRWKFNDFYKKSLLLEHDKNKNALFDEDEQKEIIEEFAKHIKEQNYLTQILYLKKDQRLKKRLIEKIDLKKANLTFKKDEIEFRYSFDMDFVLEKNHRLFIRFIDPQKILHVDIKDVVIEGYKEKKVTVVDGIRVNIYLFDYKPKY